MEHGKAATLIGNRYVIEAPLGRGGMAVVSLAHDRTTGDRVALKQLVLSGPATTMDRARMLFERECRTLALLRHPRIVRVFDFGVDDNIPYYTMELLDGGDLTERTPRPWREACAIGRDVCSALSMIHARRMVYRDLSPRNVRCTSDGMAKLIDFGAMAPMGSAEFVVCTPAVAAPELVNLQSLDGRADLYAFGAVLYLTLTGRMPYPASGFHLLPELWKHAIAPPSAYVENIPEALDNLVMELLKLDPQRRPASAAEVSERICAIAELSHDERLVESQAYLTTPELSGRDAELEVLEGWLQRVKLDRRGGALLLRGAAGQGRSRMLEAGVSLAKLQGVTVLRASGDDGAGRLEAVYRLADQLLSNLPDAASLVPPDAWPVLAQLVPALRRLTRDDPMDHPAASDDVQPEVPIAFRAWLLAVAREQPVMIGVDDVERLDVESRNLIALLADRASQHALLVVVARSDDDTTECDALRLLDAKSSAIAMHPLTLAEVRALLESVFGDVPHLAALAAGLSALASGNPRRLMQLARHLLDQGLVRHQRGGWTLTANVSDIGLPSSMAETTAAIVDGLSQPARALAEAVALGGVDQRFDIADLLRLTTSAHADELLSNLTELTTTSVLVAAGGTYRLAGREWLVPLLPNITAARMCEVHTQLSEIFAQRGDGPRQSFHLIRAGRKLEGVDALARFAETSCTATDADPDAYLRFLEQTPDDWRAIYGEALACAIDHPRRKHVEYAIRTRLIGILVHSSGASDGHFEALMRDLADDAGLNILASLDPTIEPMERLKTAIARAYARHEARPEAEQVVDPLAALQRLARAVTTAGGHVANSMDFEMWRRLPSLQPMAALSPALGVVAQLAAGADARFAGRYGESRRLFVDLLARLAPPNEVGLAQSYVHGIRVGVGTVVGLYAAQLGNAAWRRSAAEVTLDPIHATNALLIQSLGQLWAGDVLACERTEDERKRQRLEHRRPQAYEGLGVLWRFMGHVACEDLTRTRNGLDEIERLASRSLTWEPTAIWARAEYERIRGDHATALRSVDDALSRIQPGRHLLWSSAATTRLLILISLGRQAECERDGEAYLAVGTEVGLDHLLASLHLATALANAKQGDAARAWGHIDSAQGILAEHDAGGLRLGLAFEAAASVAIYLRDAEAFDRYGSCCRELYRAHDNRSLRAKYDRLVRAATRAGLIARSESLLAPAPSAQTEAITKLEGMLVTCPDPASAVGRTLELIAASVGAREGYVFTLVDDEPVLWAQLNSELPSAALKAAARALLLSEQDDDGVTQDADASDPRLHVSDVHNAYQAVVIGHHRRGSFITHGLVMLLVSEPIPEHTRQLARRLSEFLQSSSSTVTLKN